MNFYKEAAKVLDDLMAKKQGSLKTLVFNSKSMSSVTEQKRLYALLSETLKSYVVFAYGKLMSREGYSRQCD